MSVIKAGKGYDSVHKSITLPRREVTWDIRPWGSGGEEAGKVIVEAYIEDDNGGLETDLYMLLPKSEVAKLISALASTLGEDE